MVFADTAATDRLSWLAQSSPADLAVRTDRRGVEIRMREPALSFYHSFVTGPLARRAKQSKQALLRACNNKSRDILSVLDLTAGWGADSLTLARHGQQVLMLEQDALLCAILDYSLQCLAQEGDDRATFGRMRIENIEAAAYLEKSDPTQAFDCIYLDPMFPPHKSSAKPSADMQLLQLMTANHEIENCFELARKRARRRVVVKRPLKAANLGDDKPDIVYREKSIRFDVYLC